MERNVGKLCFQGMDLSKVLLLLLSTVFSELSLVQSKPLDFVCNSEARRVMNKVKQLQEDLVPQRKAEILLSLGSLVQDVRRARERSQQGCGQSLLVRLERSITNYLHVLTQVQQGESEVTEAPPCLGQDSQDLGLVLRQFERLISGKLEWLIMDMAQAC